jgi:hypothetical protein
MWVGRQRNVGNCVENEEDRKGRTEARIDQVLGREASRLLSTAFVVFFSSSFSVYASFTCTKFPYADISIILVISIESLKLYLVLSFFPEDLPVDGNQLTKFFVPLTGLMEILK